MTVSCLSYRVLIDPLLRSLRGTIAALVPAGSSVIEIGCGTGAQARALAGRCERYLGVDLDPDMTDCARKRCRAPGCERFDFRQADGADLRDLAGGEFDCAVLTLALHEMPQPARLAVLREMRRVARHVIVADYAAPLPSGPAGRLARTVERIAGGAHYAGFRHYQEIGGLHPLLSAAGLAVEEERTVLRGIAHLARCRSASLRDPVPAGRGS
jgi:SAM-dependent methyltransferase